MKKHLLSICLLAGSFTLHAQQEIFAITGKNFSKIEFKDFRTLHPDAASEKIFFNSEDTPSVISQNTQNHITEDRNAYGNSQAMQLAALAYNEKENQLIYMPMFSSNIYFLDVKTRKITLVENKNIRISACDVNSHITRMTAGYDGNFYAMDNAGTQFLKIQKMRDGQYSVENLGIVKDDPSNGKNSFTAMETGFGGDIIADTENNFYVISGAGNIFKFSPQKLSAVFIGKIKGLPEEYTVNGAAVNSDGKIVVASAKSMGMFEFALNDRNAKLISTKENLPVYDLASKYFVHQKLSSLQNSAQIKIFPTKVEDRKITVVVQNRKTAGKLNLSILDVAGRTVLEKYFSVKSDDLQEEIIIPQTPAGSYVVRITNQNGETLHSEKILITK